MISSDDDAYERLATLGELAAEVAHELSSVLQIVASNAYVARNAVDRGDVAEARPLLANVQRHVHVAHGIVDGLMGLARGEPVPKEATALRQVTAAARESVGERATFNDAIEPPDLHAPLHALLFARLLHALYDNAAAASAPRRPTVTTTARESGGALVVEVWDDGPGVTNAIAERLFEPFVTDRHGGTGLGLALARRIATAHGGTISFVDGGTGGARFRVEVPMRA